MKKKKESIVLPLISIVIGVLALILSWIPFVNNSAAILAIVGFILAIIALVINRKNKKTLSIVGVVISIVAFIIVLATQSYYGSQLDKALNTDNSSSEIEKTSGTAESKSSSSSSKKDTGWNSSTKTFTGDDSIIKIDKVVQTTDYDGKPAAKVYFTITNTGAEAEYVQVLFLNSVRIQQKSTNTSNDLDFATMPSDEAGNTEEDHTNDNINPNGSVSGFYPVLLENSTDPLQLLFSKNYKTVATYEIALK